MFAFIVWPGGYFSWVFRSKFAAASQFIILLDWWELTQAEIWFVFELHPLCIQVIPGALEIANGMDFFTRSEWFKWKIDLTLKLSARSRWNVFLLMNRCLWIDECTRNVFLNLPFPSKQNKYSSLNNLKRLTWTHKNYHKMGQKYSKRICIEIKFRKFSFLFAFFLHRTSLCKTFTLHLITYSFILTTVLQKYFSSSN